MSGQTDSATQAAEIIVASMSDEDRALFAPDAWREGVGNLISGSNGAWDHLDADDILGAIEARLAAAGASLVAEKLADGWTVVDRNGGRWWPGELAQEEIARANNEAREALRLCIENPSYGIWKM